MGGPGLAASSKGSFLELCLRRSPSGPGPAVPLGPPPARGCGRGRPLALWTRRSGSELVLGANLEPSQEIGRAHV